MLALVSYSEALEFLATVLVCRWFSMVTLACLDG